MAVTAAVIVILTLAAMTTGRLPAVLALICALVAGGLLESQRPRSFSRG
ncbi:hypothetical protein [Mycolicibacterium sp. CBMA 226]|nr:hypothetical protein [Mycolicibacterium sp. CBMA 226]